MTELTIKDFKVASCQLSLFHSPIVQARTTLLKEILSKFGDQFDGDPMAFPIPNEAPSDIPRIILTNKKPNIKLEVSLTRTNLFRFELPGEGDLNIADFYRTNQNNYKEYLNLIQTSVNRIAGVIKRYAFCDNPGIYLARHFCKDRWDQQPFNRPESFELHAHKTFNLYNKDKFGEQVVNSWVRCKSGFRKDETGSSSKIILVEQDLNTVGDENTRKIFNITEIDNFFNAIPSKFDEIMNLYFPKG